MDSLTDFALLGDIVLCRRPSFLQGLNEAAGDPFRHAGIIGPGGDVIQMKDDVVASLGDDAALPIGRLLSRRAAGVCPRRAFDDWTHAGRIGGSGLEGILSAQRSRAYMFGLRRLRFC